MTFRAWLREQQDRNDPVGDLARDVRQNKPRERSVAGLRSRLLRSGACYGAMNALDRAAREYGSLWRARSVRGHDVLLSKIEAGVTRH